MPSCKHHVKVLLRYGTHIVKGTNKRRILDGIVRFRPDKLIKQNKIDKITYVQGMGSIRVKGFSNLNLYFFYIQNVGRLASTQRGATAGWAFNRNPARALRQVVVVYSSSSSSS